MDPNFQSTAPFRFDRERRLRRNSEGETVERHGRTAKVAPGDVRLDSRVPGLNDADSTIVTLCHVFRGLGLGMRKGDITWTISKVAEAAGDGAP